MTQRNYYGPISIGEDNVDANTDSVERLVHYIERLRNRMGMHNWALQIAVGTEGIPAADEHTVLGACQVSYGRRHARIYIAEGWETWEPEKLRRVCVHELLHCPFQTMTNFKDNLESQVAPAVYTLLSAAWVDAMEYTMDAIGQGVEVGMPLIGED